MDLDTRRFADSIVISPSGRLDHASAGRLRAALAPILERCAAGRDAVVVDLSRVEHIGSAALAVLMRSRQQAAAHAGTVVVAALPARVAELFEISRVAAVFDVFPSVRDALDRVSPAARAAFDAGS